MNCAAIDKLTLWHARPPARTFHFRRKRRTRGNLKRQSNPRVWRSVLKLLYPCNSTPSSSPSNRIRFNHRIAPANEKDWLVTGAKSPLIVGGSIRVFLPWKQPWRERFVAHSSPSKLPRYSGPGTCLIPPDRLLPFDAHAARKKKSRTVILVCAWARVSLQ